MDDLGDALKSDQPVNMLGGGNPAKIDAVNELFLETYKSLGDDNDTGEAVADMLFALRRERESALVLVTHDTALASRCDRVLAMEAGRLKLAE